jgi:hypothetical protein
MSVVVPCGKLIARYDKNAQKLRSVLSADYDPATPPRESIMRLRLSIAVFALVALRTGAAAAQACPPGWWCWCETARAYYPYVSSCAVPWRSVRPGPYGNAPGPMSGTQPTLPPPAAKEESQAYRQGTADWQALQAWFGSQTGDQRAGADYWAGNRSKQDHKSCEAAVDEFAGDKTAFLDGCRGAKQKLDPMDIRRRTEPDYRAGFNDAAMQKPLSGQSEPQPAAIAPPPPAPPKGVLVINNHTCFRISGIKIDDVARPTDLGPGDSLNFDIDNRHCSHTASGAAKDNLNWNTTFECKDGGPIINHTITWIESDQSLPNDVLPSDSVIVESGRNGYLGKVEITSKIDCLSVQKITANRGNCKINDPGLPEILKFGQTISAFYFCEKLLELDISTDKGDGIFTFVQ